MSNSTKPLYQRQHIPTAAHLWHKARARGAGNYFLFCREYYRILPKLEALFLQDLINLAGMAKTENDWFWCTVEYLEEIGWTVNEQKKLLRSLATRGFVVSRKRGQPVSRWLFIDYERLEASLEETDGHIKLGPNPPVATGEYRPVNKVLPSVVLYTEENQSHTRFRKAASPPAETEGLGGKTLLVQNVPSSPHDKYRARLQNPRPEHFGFANRLRTAVVKAGWAKRRWVESSWAKEFAALCNNEGVEKVVKALDWLIPKLGQKYCLHIRCARQFRERFGEIEEKMAGRSVARKGDPPPSDILSDKALEVARDLRDWKSWKDDDELPRAVQKALDFAQDLHRRLQPFHKRCVHKRDKTPVEELACAVLSDFCYPEEYVKGWFTAHEWWFNSDGFRSTMTRQAPSLTHKDFVDYARKVSVGATGDAGTWEKLKKEIYP